MIALAQPDAFPLLLLRGRIAFRTGWALRARRSGKHFRDKDQVWMDGYDEDHNFAHMGARLIDDENWGLPKKKMQKKKVAPLSPEVMRMLKLMRPAKKSAKAEGLTQREKTRG
jgi:hypothetical protein